MSNAGKGKKPNHGRNFKKWNESPYWANREKEMKNERKAEIRQQKKGI